VCVHQDTVIRNFEVIAAASHNFYKNDSKLFEKNSDVPLLFAYEMRNSLAHGYHRLDREIVCTTTNQHLPDLHT
jgi:uncharacterized protein with HEPN domain